VPNLVSASLTDKGAKMVPIAPLYEVAPFSRIASAVARLSLPLNDAAA